MPALTESMQSTYKQKILLFTLNTYLLKLLKQIFSWWAHLNKARTPQLNLQFFSFIARGVDNTLPAPRPCIYYAYYKQFLTKLLRFKAKVKNTLPESLVLPVEI